MILAKRVVSETLRVRAVLLKNVPRRQRRLGEYHAGKDQYARIDTIASVLAPRGGKQ